MTSTLAQSSLLAPPLNRIIVVIGRQDLILGSRCCELRNKEITMQNKCNNDKYMFCFFTRHSIQLAGQSGRIFGNILINIHVSAPPSLHSAKQKCSRIHFANRQQKISTIILIRNNSILTRSHCNPSWACICPALLRQHNRFGSSICLQFQGMRSSARFGTTCPGTIINWGY